jgi:hypothetical protein
LRLQKYNFFLCHKQLLEKIFLSIQ